MPILAFFVVFFCLLCLGLFLCMLPCIPIYLKEDMTIKQVLIQRIVEWIVLEISMYAAIRLVIGELLPKSGCVAILFSVTFFDVLSYLIKWYLEKEEAEKINRRIREHRMRREQMRKDN